jgi:hypothetical protein
LLITILCLLRCQQQITPVCTYFHGVDHIRADKVISFSELPATAQGFLGDNQVEAQGILGAFEVKCEKRDQRLGVVKQTLVFLYNSKEFRWRMNLGGSVRPSQDLSILTVSFSKALLAVEPLDDSRYCTQSGGCLICYE